MRLLLIRHGQTPSNVLGLLDTAVPGPGLTDLGDRAGGRTAGHPGRLPDRRDLRLQPAPRAAHGRAAGRGAGLPIRCGTDCARSHAGDLEMLGDDDVDPHLSD